MTIHSTYSVKLNTGVNGKAFRDTVHLYRNAVDFYIHVMLEEWDVFVSVSGSKAACNLAEKLTVATKKRPVVPYDFRTEFYKFPSYLRRSAIAEAYGKCCSYKYSLANWENADRRERGAEPSGPKAGYIYPAMYRDNCYVRLDTYTARVKVYIRNTWDWVTVHFRKSDADYIAHHCSNRKECVPTLQRRGKCWYLDFSFQEETELHNKDIYDQVCTAPRFQKCQPFMEARRWCQ